MGPYSLTTEKKDGFTTQTISYTSRDDRLLDPNTAMSREELLIIRGNLIMMGFPLMFLWQDFNRGKQESEKLKWNLEKERENE